MDVAETTGLSFIHENGSAGSFYLPEITGSGVALIDYDNDGDLDVYLVQSGSLANTIGTQPNLTRQPRDQLFRNNLTMGPDNQPNMSFENVTSTSGIDGPSFGQGVITGDYDNDGWVDLYITNLGTNQLLRNMGNGSFEDVTKQAGVGDTGFGVPAVFFDYNRDGWLDLFVGNYVQYSLAFRKACYLPNGALDYCGPLAFEPQADRLYRNRRDGTFEDVSLQTGLVPPFGAALGVVAADFNGDQWPDLYVANDGTPNQLWINQNGQRFTNQAVLSGCAVNNEGQPEASMGIAIGDPDDDGDLDLFLSHLTQETNTFYSNDGMGVFYDRSLQTGLATPSWRFTGFGTGFLDFDNDSHLDLFVANGAVKTIDRLASLEDPFPFHEPNLLFQNTGQGRFRELKAPEKWSTERSEVSRGAAMGDLDNDGDTDLIVTNNKGPVRLLLNQQGNLKPWIGLTLEAKGQITAGTKVQISCPEQKTLTRWSGLGGGYASSGDPRILIGLDGCPQGGAISVTWPDGKVEVWRDLAFRRYHRLQKGAAPVATEPVP